MRKEIKPIKEFLGMAFAGFKGQEAINKLLEEKRGYVPSAFYRDDIGKINLVWGDEDGGLCHLIRQREKQGINITDFIENLNEVIEKGNIHVNKYSTNRINIWYNGKMITVETSYNHKKFIWILTAFKQTKEPNI